MAVKKGMAPAKGAWCIGMLVFTLDWTLEYWVRGMQIRPILS